MKYYKEPSGEVFGYDEKNQGDFIEAAILAGWEEQLVWPIPSNSGPVIPASITQRQARIAMLDAGILDDVETAIASMTGVEGKKAQIAWEWASEIRRDDPLLISIAGCLGLNSEQIDQLFLEASKI